MENAGWKEKVNQYKIPLGLSLIGVILIVGGVFFSGINQQKPKIFPNESIKSVQKIISVDVSGAVVKVGVYQLKDGSRVEDAIAAAGGLNEEANREYVSKYLNMAQRLSDGIKIYIPFAGEDGIARQGAGIAGVNNQSKININTASQIEIEALPGIGPVTAVKIISGRPYQQVADLLNKKAVSQSVFEKIKDQVAVY